MITVFLVWLAIAAPPAVPEPPETEARPFELGWDAPPECPPESSVRARIEQHLGASVDTAGGRGLAVEARIDPTQAGYRVVLEMTRDGERRTRSLPESPTCEEASQAAALIVAIAIDPTVSTRIPEPDAPSEEPIPELAPAEPEPQPQEPEPIPEPVPPSQTTPSNEPTTVPLAAAPPSRPPLGGFLGLRGGLSYGDQPWPSGTVGIAGGLFGRLFRVELDARYAPPHVRQIREAEVTFQLWTVGLAAGPRVSPRTWLDLWACVGIEAGQTRVDPNGLENTAPAREPWFAVTVRPTLAFVPLRRLALFVAPEVFIPITRPEYLVGGAGQIHRPTPAGIRALLGLEIRFE